MQERHPSRGAVCWTRGYLHLTLFVVGIENLISASHIVHFSLFIERVLIYSDSFRDYISYCRQLKFEETPNYDHLRSLFRTTRSSEFNPNEISGWKPQ